MRPPRCTHPSKGNGGFAKLRAPQRAHGLLKPTSSSGRREGLCWTGLSLASSKKAGKCQQVRAGCSLLSGAPQAHPSFHPPGARVPLVVCVPCGVLCSLAGFRVPPLAEAVMTLLDGAPGARGRHGQ